MLTQPALLKREHLSLRNAPGAGVELRELIRILMRRRVVVISAVLVGTGLGIVCSICAKREYSATATIEMNKETGSSLGLTDLSGIATGLGEQDQMNVDLLTQQSVILSDNTALLVIEKLRLDSSPPFAVPAPETRPEFLQERGASLDQAPHQRERALRIFRKGLEVSLLKGTRLLTVTYTDTDPNRATAIANAIVDAYRNESTQARFQASSKVSSWLAGQLADLKRKVEESQAKADAFQRGSGLSGMRTVGIGDEDAADSTGKIAAAHSGSANERSHVHLSDVGNVALQRLLELNRDLTGAEVGRIAKEAISRMAETQDPEVVLGIGSSGLADNQATDPSIAAGSMDLSLLRSLRQQFAEITVQIATAGTRYGAKNPAMMQLQNEQESIQTQIKSEMAHIRVRASNDLHLAILAENGIRRQIAEQEQIVDRATEKGEQLILLQEEAESNRAIYQDLYSKLEEASVTAGIRASNVTLVDPARTPAEPSYPKKKQMLGFGALAGLFLGLATAFSWDYFDDSIVLPEQVEQLTTVPVIGVIPDFHPRQNVAEKYGLALRRGPSAARESSSWLLEAPRSHIAESYRALRTSLLLSRAERAPRLVLFISGSPEEGKSTTCFNTATAFALQGGSVLYLDGDLRRPRGHRFFGCANDAGLTTCLATGMAAVEALKKHSDISSLFLLPAGPLPPNPSELLGSHAFSDLLSGLRDRFDYVFVDSPPVLLVTDAQLISPLVDGYVLVLRSNKTSRRHFTRTLSQLGNAKSPLLGVLINAFDARSAAYCGYRHYGEESGYYADAKG
jgi:succinoglycan biosynthesis transport protein ExoP